MKPPPLHLRLRLSLVGGDKLLAYFFRDAERAFAMRGGFHGAVLFGGFRW